MVIIVTTASSAAMTESIMMRALLSPEVSPDGSLVVLMEIWVVTVRSAGGVLDGSEISRGEFVSVETVLSMRAVWCI